MKDIFEELTNICVTEDGQWLPLTQRLDQVVEDLELRLNTMPYSENPASMHLYLEEALRPLLKIGRAVAKTACLNQGYSSSLVVAFQDRARLGEDNIDLISLSGKVIGGINHWLLAVADLEENTVIEKYTTPKPLAVNDRARTTNQIEKLSDVLLIDKDYAVKEFISDEDAAFLWAQIMIERSRALKLS